MTETTMQPTQSKKILEILENSKSYSNFNYKQFNLIKLTVGTDEWFSYKTGDEYYFNNNLYLSKFLASMLKKLNKELDPNQMEYRISDDWQNQEHLDNLKICLYKYHGEGRKTSTMIDENKNIYCLLSVEEMNKEEYNN